MGGRRDTITIPAKLSGRPIRFWWWRRADGAVTGGGADGHGIRLSFQEGPVKHTPNGCAVEDLLEIAYRFLEVRNTAHLRNPHTTEAAAHIDQALACLDARATDRKGRGVLGTYEK